MASLSLHHVSLIVTDLERSATFYRELFDLEPLERPPFAIEGMWLACGPVQVHLIVHPTGTFRTNDIDNDDTHVAFNTDDFEGFVAKLAAHGFREDAAESDPMRLLVRRTGLAGFPQLYLIDPDRNVIEVNGAP
jgi:glyoxylase I family protein